MFIFWKTQNREWNEGEGEGHKPKKKGNSENEGCD
jgi:hypothetical protein